VLIDKKEITLRNNARVAPGKGEIEFHYTGHPYWHLKIHFKYQLRVSTKNGSMRDTSRLLHKPSPDLIDFA
jgi:hypothetical protein